MVAQYQNRIAIFTRRDLITGKSGAPISGNGTRIVRRRINNDFGMAIRQKFSGTLVSFS